MARKPSRQQHSQGSRRSSRQHKPSPRTRPQSQPRRTGTGFLPAQTARLASRYSPKAPEAENTRLHKVCINCYRARNRRKQLQRRSPQAPKANLQAVQSDPISQIIAFQATDTPSDHDGDRDGSPPAHGSFSRTLSHHIFTKGEWRRARLRDHLRVPVTIALDSPKTSRSGIPPQAPLPLAGVSAIVDTEAQSDLWALSCFLACGPSRDHLHPICLSLSSANRSPIAIEGAFFTKLTTKSPQGVESSCRSIVYVSSSVHDMYLPYESLLNLGLLANGFPGVDNIDDRQPGELGKTPPINVTRSLNDGCGVSPTLHSATCFCLQRTALPLYHLPPPSAVLHGGPANRDPR